MNEPNVAAEEAAFAGSYLVYPLPLESPYFGNRQVVTNPEDLTASPFGWHDTNGAEGAEFTITRGNNVYAYDDIANANVAGASPDGGAGLVFNNAFDLVDGDALPRFSTANRSLDAATVNAFYWSNIIHDITYQYGFDEASGNFQENNYGKGGAAGDSVNGEIQDGSGTCNANFGTPPDGFNPRMQMFICDIVNPGYDGSYDNLVIVHEYAHGISTRLTGGSGNSENLNNQEQMGEGWSDYYGYMYTMDASNFNQDRTVGTFLFGGTFLGGPPSSNPLGIRDAPYSTSMTTNSLTYDFVRQLGNDPAPPADSVAPHRIGQVWATMLYEMTQGLIAQHGFDSDLYNGTGGNNISMQLVTEALKLQPVSPGFIDGRDAILAADTILNNGENQCIIWEAFAKRGLGFSATQGITDVRTDNVEAFDLPPVTLNLTQDSFCSAEETTMIGGVGAASGGVFSGLGVTDNGDGLTFEFDPSTAGTGNHTITFNGLNCQGAAEVVTDTINVTEVLPELAACSNVTLELSEDGTVTFDAFTPSQLVVVGGNNGSNSQGTTSKTITISEDVTLSFDWAFATTDSNGQFDSIGYAINGSFTAVSNASGNTQNGSETVNLTVGQTFAFVAFTSDNGFGNATGTFTNFSPALSGNLNAINWIDNIQNSDGTATFSGAATALDAVCGASTVTYSQETFTCNDIGTTIVTITVTDSIGNEDTCTAQITIEDKQTPSLVLNGDASMTVSQGATFIDPSVTVTDNCAVVGDVVMGGDVVDTNTLGTYTVTYNVTDSAGNVATQLTRDVVVENTDYVFDNGAWTPSDPSGVATAFNTISILDTTTEAVITTSTGIGSLTLAAGSTLDTGVHILSVVNAITVSGANASVEGSLILDGAAAQAVTGTSGSLMIDHLEINNTNGVTTSVPIAITETLKLTNGVFTTNDNVTFKSTASQSGMLDQVTGGAIAGDVIVERYISSKRAFRLLTSAVTTTSSIRDNWQEGVNNTSTAFPAGNMNPNPGFGTHISGSTTGTDGFDATASGNSSMFTLNNVGQSWAAVSNTDVNVLVAGQPYRILVRGSRDVNLTTNTAAPSETILRSQGALSVGTVTQSFVTDATVNAQEFFLIGNPYQASVDMNSVLSTGTQNINSNFYYVWDPIINGDNGRGGFVTVDLSDGTNTDGSAANEFLQPGQGVFVALASTASGLSTSVAFEEIDKNVGQNTTVFAIENSQTDAVLIGQLYRDENGVQALSDSFKVNFGAAFSNEINLNDAAKPFNIDENIGITRGQNTLSIERRAMPLESDDIPLITTTYRATDYQFRFMLAGLEESDVYLEDTFLETLTPLVVGDNFVSYSVSDEDESSASDRFKIRFGNDTLGSEDVTLVKVALYPNPLKEEVLTLSAPALQGKTTQVKLRSMLGQEVLSLTRVFETQSIEIDQVNELAAGVYVLSITSDLGTVTKRFIKQ